MNKEERFPIKDYFPLTTMSRERDKLYEGLIKTYSVSDTISLLNHNGLKRGVDYELTHSDGTTEFDIIFKKEENTINDIISKMETYGWKVSETHDFKVEGEIRLTFNAKFDTIEVDRGHRVGNTTYYDREDFYYHLTPYTLGDKILRNGLSPKSGNKKVELTDRIYLFKPTIDIEISNLLGQLFKSNPQDYSYKNKYYLLKVFINQMELPVRLFTDPHYRGGVYTLENIHPKYIKHYRTYFLNKNGFILSVVNEAVQKDINRFKELI